MTANTGNIIDTRAAPVAQPIAPSRHAAAADLSPVRTKLNED